MCVELDQRRMCVFVCAALQGEEEGGEGGGHGGGVGAGRHAGGTWTCQRQRRSEPPWTLLPIEGRLAPTGCPAHPRGHVSQTLETQIASPSALFTSAPRNLDKPFPGRMHMQHHVNRGGGKCWELAGFDNPVICHAATPDGRRMWNHSERRQGWCDGTEPPSPACPSRTAPLSPGHPPPDMPGTPVQAER